jgi:hypothetical protein
MVVHDGTSAIFKTTSLPMVCDEDNPANNTAFAFL